ncbi:MAG: ATP-binding protein [Candidatus Altiarchaeota archaeon]|nr:ATP-binding protein [Candidatus Altiarchaeota archaeon]
MGIGQVIGSTTLRSFKFVIKEGQEDKVKRDEFVTVVESVSGKKILGVVKDIVISNELLPDEFGRDLRMEDIILKEGEYPVPIVKILGVDTDNGLELPRHGVKPGTVVELAEDELLEKILRQDPAKSAKIGTISTRENVPVYVSINDLVSRHCAVLAMTGAGKSYTVGVLIEELMSKKGSVVVFDPHGEFKEMSFKDSSVVVYDVEGSNRIKVDVNSLGTSDFVNLMPDLTTTQRDLLEEVIGLADRFYEQYDLGNILRILEVVYDVKKGDGKKKKEDVEQPQSPEFFDDSILKSITKKVTLPTIGALMRRIRRLERMGVFSIRGTPIEGIVKSNQLTIINLSEAEERVSEIVVSAICRKIFEARRKFMKDEGEGVEVPTLVIMEEAHNFAPRAVEGDYAPARGIIRKIAREGRKFGVGLCVVSQRPNKLDQDVLSQCNTQIIMKVVNPADQEYIRQSVESVTEDVVRDLPSLARGEAIVVGSAIKLPVPVKIRERTTKVGGGDIDIVGVWNAI